MNIIHTHNPLYNSIMSNNPEYQVLLTNWPSLKDATFILSLSLGWMNYEAKDHLKFEK